MHFVTGFFKAKSKYYIPLIHQRYPERKCAWGPYLKLIRDFERQINESASTKMQF